MEPERKLLNEAEALLADQPTPADPIGHLTPTVQRAKERGLSNEQIISAFGPLAEMILKRLEKP